MIATNIVFNLDKTIDENIKVVYEKFQQYVV